MRRQSHFGRLQREDAGSAPSHGRSKVPRESLGLLEGKEAESTRKCSERYPVPLRKPNPARSPIAAHIHASLHLGQERPQKLDKAASATVGQVLALLGSLQGAAAAPPPPRQRLSVGCSPSRGGWGSAGPVDTPGRGRLQEAPESGCLRGCGWPPAAPSTAAPWSGSCSGPGAREKKRG